MTVMFTVFNNKLASYGISFNPTGVTDSSLTSIQGLDAAAYAYFTERAKDAIVTAFYAITPFLWLGVFAVAAMGNVNITKEGKGLEGEGERDFSENTMEGSYVLSVLRRRKTRAPVEKQKGDVVAGEV